MTVALRFHWLKVGHCSHPECITQRSGRWRAVQFPALAALLVHPTRGPMLFDTGYSERFLAATNPFPERFYRWTMPVTFPAEQSLTLQLKRLGYTPDQIEHLFISHLHADHIAGIADFPSARLHAMRKEFEAMHPLGRLRALGRGFLPALLPADTGRRLEYAEDAARVALPASLRSLGEGFDLLGDRSVIAVPLPGHSAGQMGLAFRSTSDRTVLLTADAFWSLDALIGDRPPGSIARHFFADQRAYHETFARLRRVARSGSDVLLAASHCGSTWQRVRDES